MTFRATASHLSKLVCCDLYVCLRLVQPFRLFWKCYTFTYCLVTFGLRLSCGSCKSIVWIIRLDTFGATVSWILGTRRNQKILIKFRAPSRGRGEGPPLWPPGPQWGSPLRLVTFEIRFYYVWEHPSNSLKKRPCQVWYRSVAGSLKPFGMRLGYVSCNSIANEQFESTNLYVCIRLVQPFHRFVSGPLRLVTFVYV